MIPLEQIHVAAPCHANWDEMTGTDQARFCQSCRKNVYNLSEMTRAEAEALIYETEGRLCVRFYTRADGTVLTQDCPVGLRAVRVKLARKLSYAAALLLSCGAGLLRWTGMAQAVTPVKSTAAVTPPTKSRSVWPKSMHTMGKPAVPHKARNPSVGPDPFALPGPREQWVGGMIAPPRPTMGAPVALPVPPAAEPAKPHQHRNR